MRGRAKSASQIARLEHVVRGAAGRALPARDARRARDAVDERRRVPRDLIDGRETSLSVEHEAQIAARVERMDVFIPKSLRHRAEWIVAQLPPSEEDLHLAAVTDLRPAT